MKRGLGIALLLALATGGGVAFLSRDRGAPPAPPAPATDAPVAPGIIAPEIEADRPPPPVPVPPPVDDPGAPLERVPRSIDLPGQPVAIQIRDPAGPGLRAGPPPGEGGGAGDPPTDAGTSPTDPVTGGAGDSPAAPGGPATPESPAEELPEGPTEPEQASAPGQLPAGPVDDPSQLTTPDQERKPEPPGPGEPVPPPVPPPPPPDGLLDEIHRFLHLSSADGSIQIKFTGRVWFDGALMSPDQELQDQVGGFDDGFEFRAVRIGVLGVVKSVEFKIDYDVSGGDRLIGSPKLKDLWVGMKGLLLVERLRIGRQREPVGLEQSMSSNAWTFMEAGLPLSLTPGRNLGLLAFGHEFSGRLFWAAGVFGYTESGSTFGAPGANLTARLCGTPLYLDDGKQLLHLGISGSLRNFTPDQVTLASRPEAHLAPNIVSTGGFSPGRVYIVGLEAAYLDGPCSLQSELVRYSTDIENTGRATFWGAYLYGSWILTGEQRRYRGGMFMRPLVKESAFENGVGGVLELAARLSYLNLANDALDGGTVTDATLGLNWYLDNHIRLMINYIHGHRESVGTANILQFRIQFDF